MIYKGLVYVNILNFKYYVFGYLLKFSRSARYHYNFVYYLKNWKRIL